MSAGRMRPAADAAVSVGVDIGGTFTDIVALVERDGRHSVDWTKVPSTPSAPTDGVLHALEKALARVELPLSSLSRFTHATTVGTNAVLERKGARLAVLMTEGFEDTLEIGRQKRTQMYELELEPETPGFLCPAERRFGIRERIGCGGEVIRQFDSAGLKEVVEMLAEQGVEAVAVCYLFSFQNGEHERLTRLILNSAAPDLAVSLSHEVSPVFREYERLCVTAFDAYLRPVMATYLSRLHTRLTDVGFTGAMQTMKSRGGLASIEGAVEQPVTTMLSGPAAGVIGARFVAEAAEMPNVVTLDMGGTSADIALIRKGHSLTSTQGGIGRYPLNIPMVDVQTIGAGGGSIAWLDGAGGIRVGPQSAGSDPGPACYGNGGSEPTVTDASLVLGYLDPEHFLGGGLALDLDASWRALESLARELEMSVPATALGVHRIVNANMADAIRLASVKRGYDPRQFALMAFGGAGPVCGGAVTAAMGMECCIVPRAPGVLSALGLLASEVQYDNAQTFVEPVDSAVLGDAEALLAELRESGLRQMAADGYEPDECETRYSADIRYVGQSSELEVAIELPLDAGSAADCVALFERTHERVYGYASQGARTEFVNLRVVVAKHPEAVISDVLEGGFEPASSVAEANGGFRGCWFSAEGETRTPIFHRGMSAAALEVDGPAIVQQEDTTVVVYPEFHCRTDKHGNLILMRKERG